MLRIVAVLILIVHGIGHVMAPVSAWVPGGSAFSRGSWLLSPGVTIDSAAGRALAVLWIIPLVGFIGGAIGLWTGAGWWREALLVSSVVSIVVVLPWWRVMPTGSYLGALAVDLLVLVALLTPWGDRLVRLVA